MTWTVCDSLLWLIISSFVTSKLVWKLHQSMLESICFLCIRQESFKQLLIRRTEGKKAVKIQFLGPLEVIKLKREKNCAQHFVPYRTNVSLRHKNWRKASVWVMSDHKNVNSTNLIKFAQSSRTDIKSNELLPLLDIKNKLLVNQNGTPGINSQETKSLFGDSQRTEMYFIEIINAQINKNWLSQWSCKYKTNLWPQNY